MLRIRDREPPLLSQITKSWGSNANISHCSRSRSCPSQRQASCWSGFSGIRGSRSVALHGLFWKTQRFLLPVGLWSYRRRSYLLMDTLSTRLLGSELEAGWVRSLELDLELWYLVQESETGNIVGFLIVKPKAETRSITVLVSDLGSGLEPGWFRGLGLSL